MNETDEIGITKDGIDDTEFVYNTTESNENVTEYNGRNDFTGGKSDIFQFYGIVFSILVFILILSVLVFILLVKFNCKKCSRHKLSKTRKNEKESSMMLLKVPNKILIRSPDVPEEGNKTIVYNVSNNQVVKNIEKKYMMPVKMQEFERYTEIAFRAGALSAAFTIIKNTANEPCIYGSLPELKRKNRYANLFPCDENRVILEKILGDPYSDYINASFITGYGGFKKTYIAAQGPTEHTVIDFWRMIWQEKVEIVCMVVNLISHGKKKCEQYWPSKIGDNVLYGSISVNQFSEEVYLDFIYRRFLIANGKQETRIIQQLHFTAWPDHDVPLKARSLVDFLKKFHSLVPIPRTGFEPPILVHSSGGIGRTGTLIVLDMALCRIFSEKMINVYADVVSVRKERMNMISNVRQYLFIHLVLMEYLNSKETCIACDEKLPNAIEEAKKKSAYYYKRIQDVEWRTKVFNFWELSRKQTPTNKTYNIEGSHTIDRNDIYEAVVNIDDIVKNRRYLTARLPTPYSAVNFWKLIVEQDVNFVLFLQLPSLDIPIRYQFVSEDQFYVNTKQLKIVKRECSRKIIDCYVKEEVGIVDAAKYSQSEKIVKIVTYNNWPEDGVLPAEKELVKLWTAVEDMHKKNEVCSIAIICRDGVTASGLWLSLTFLIKNMAYFKECDVPYAARAIRKCNNNFISSQEHLKYLFGLASEWSSLNKKM